MAFPKIEGYVVTEKLGSGSYSTVYKAYTKVGGRQAVAIKCVEKARVLGGGATAADDLLREIRLLKTLRHPHIVHMHDFCWDQRNIYIIMEYCCGGDLSKYIHRYGRVPERQVLYFLQQLASALKFLREKGVVHMDLKPHNLLLQRASDGKRVLKLADFGFAAVLVGEGVGIRGSPLYMAPEVLTGRYDARADLWSVGVIMYECLFGCAPYRSPNMQQLIEKLSSKKPIQLPPGAAVSSGCRDLLSRLLQHDADARISYDDFFTHPYLDLEHMPSRENYEKAVALMKQAVELDASGQLQDALECYSKALALLVPFVAAEVDSVRRGALRDKLDSYMQRAEEIKQYLRDPTGASLKRPLTAEAEAVSQSGQRAVSGVCCVKGEQSHKDLTAYRRNPRAGEAVGREEISALQLIVAENENPEPSERSEQNGEVERRNEQSERSEQNGASEGSGLSEAGVHGGAGGRFSLRRLWGKGKGNRDDCKSDRETDEGGGGRADDACRIA